MSGAPIAVKPSMTSKTIGPLSPPLVAICVPVGTIASTVGPAVVKVELHAAGVAVRSWIPSSSMNLGIGQLGDAVDPVERLLGLVGE